MSREKKNPVVQGDLAETARTQPLPFILMNGEWQDGTPWQFVATPSSENFPNPSLCTAAFCVVTYQEKLVVVEHTKRGIELPGGHVDPDEEIPRTVEREVLEESGARVLQPTFFGYKKVSPANPIPHRDDQSKFYPFPHSFVPYYFCEAAEMLNVPLAADVKAVHLVTLQEARQLFTPGQNHHVIIQHLLQQGVIRLQ